MASHSFGDRLRLLRLAQSLSQEELAERAGLRTATVSDLERGQGDPSLNTLRSLAGALGATPGELLDGSSGSEHSLVADERALLELYRACDAERREAVRTLLALLTR